MSSINLFYKTLNILMITSELARSLDVCFCNV